MKRRVAVTGLGIVSCLGHSYLDVIQRLRSGESGVRAVPEWSEFGIRSLVAGTLEGVDEKRRAAPISKELLLGMSDAALYCSLSALDAVADAGLTEKELQSIRVGCIVGSGTGSVVTVYNAAKLAYSGQARRIDPFTILRCMSSSASAAVANLLKVQGPSYSISAACATSAHNMGHAFSLIRSGVLDAAVAGGGEEVNELVAAAFRPRMTLSTGVQRPPEGLAALRRVALRSSQRRLDDFLLDEWATRKRGVRKATRKSLATWRRRTATTWSRRGLMACRQRRACECRSMMPGFDLKRSIT